MAIYTSNTASAQLKSYFETGDIPTSNNFIDLIDSFAIYDGTLPYISGSVTSTGSFGNLYVVGNVNSNLIPSTNNTYDLGSDTFLWRNAFINHLSGSGTTGESNLTASLNIIPGQDDTYSLGSSTNEWKDLHVDGTANLDDVLISGSVNLQGALTVGVQSTGHDVKFFGDHSDHYMFWDQSANELVLGEDSKLSFHDAAGGENIVASADGHLEINAGTTLDITAPTVDINASTELNIDGDVDLNGDLDVSGTATIGTLSLAHITGSNFEMAGSGSFTTNLTANGDVTFGNASTDVHAITGKTTFTGPITASGAVSSSGTITGDKLSITSPSGIAATITTASFDYISSSLIPGNDDVQSLGSSTKEWKDLYIDGVAYIDSASITNTDITKVNSDLTPTVTNLKDLGTSALQWKDLYVDGKAYIDEISGSGTAGDSALTSSVHIVPGVDDTYSLGSTGLEWKDLFIDGTANLDNAVIGTLTLTSLSSNALPTTTNAYSLGTGSKRYTEVYTTSQSLSVSASLSAIKFENLPTTEARARLIGTGSLWLGGLSGSSRSNLLCVFTG